MTPVPFSDVFGLIRNLLVSHGFRVCGQVGLLTFLGCAFGILTLVVCHRLLYRRGYLKLSLGKDRHYEWCVMALWVVTIPTLSVAAGTLSGTWWAGSQLIQVERLGERCGKSIFKGLAAGLASTHLEKTKDARAQTVDALMKGAQKISVKDLSTYTSHHLGELSASKIWSYSPFSSEYLRGATAWTIEKTADLATYAQLGGQGDAIYKLISKVAEQDRNTDNDGEVTVEEISDVACKTFGDRGLKGLWAAIILHFLLPVGGLLAGLTALPPTLAWAVRRYVAWQSRRAARAQSGL